MLRLFAACAMLLAVPAAAQDDAMPQADHADPVSYVDDAARERGGLSQVLVLGTSHLTSLPDDFDTSTFDPMLDRLEAWAPDTIAVESLSGPQCDFLREYAFDYEGTWDTYCRDPGPARAALGLTGAQAEEEAQTLLALEARNPAQTRRLAALFLAIGEQPSALLQWLYLPEAERRADEVLTQELVDQIVARQGRNGEDEVIGVALARRLGIQRIHHVDDHTGDRASGDVDDDVYEAEIMSAWDNRFIEERIPLMRDWEAAVVAGDMAVLDWYRGMNSHEQAVSAMRGDFGAAAGAKDQPGMGGRRYLAYWETRNMRMAANMREVIGPKARMLTIVGASHAPYYERYLNVFSDVETVDIYSVLGEAN